MPLHVPISLPEGHDFKGKPTVAADVLAFPFAWRSTTAPDQVAAEAFFDSYLDGIYATDQDPTRPGQSEDFFGQTVKQGYPLRLPRVLGIIHCGPLNAIPAPYGYLPGATTLGPTLADRYGPEGIFVFWGGTNDTYPGNQGRWLKECCPKSSAPDNDPPIQGSHESPGEGKLPRSGTEFIGGEVAMVVVLDSTDYAEDWGEFSRWDYDRSLFASAHRSFARFKGLLVTHAKDPAWFSSAESDAARADVLAKMAELAPEGYDFEHVDFSVGAITAILDDYFGLE